MNELPSLPWVKIVLNMIWIFGSAVIVTLFSYYMFYRCSKKTSLKKSPNAGFLKKYLLLGAVLIILGAVSSGLFSILSEKPNVISVVKKKPVPIENFYGRMIKKRDHFILSENGVIRSDKVQFDRSKYFIKIVSRGSEVHGETARLKVFVGRFEIADFFTSTNYEERIFVFESKKMEKWRIRIGYMNDYYDPETYLNRNCFIRSVEIEKAED